ncbi:MAG: hypothetical protein ATN36_06420 [Epulopiscium sp. Nele67-Bin005]|nr:MAG: hypothetical protein ATN36_06420 [Epulopiscium sp. Nele67-Bin005]
MYLYERQAKILEYLKQQKTFVTGNEIAKIFNISDRTVRTEIQSIKKVCGEDTIIAIRTKGYQYNINSHQATVYYAFDISTVQDRIIYILKSLIFSMEGIDIYDLSEELYVSERTIELDIGRLKKLLNELELHQVCITRTNTIIKLEGIYAISNNILYEVANYQIADLSHSDLQKFFTNIHLEYLGILIMKVLNKHNYATRYLSFTRFITDIALMIESIYNHYYHYTKFYDELVSSFEEEISSYYQNIASDLQCVINQNFNVNLNTDDINYMKHILYINHHMQIFESELSKSYGVRDEFYEFCLEIFKEIKVQNGIQFIEEETSLIHSLILHLKIAVARIKLGIQLYNPLLNNLTTKYMHLIDVASMIAERLNLKYNVNFNFNEISYIGVYLATAFSHFSENLQLNTKLKVLLYIPESIGNLNLIQSQIEHVVNSNKVIIEGLTNLTSNTEIQQSVLDYHLIITTSHRFNVELHNIYIIKKSFDIACQHQISDLINTKLNHLEEHKAKKVIKAITSEKLFIPNLALSSKDEIIIYLTNLLEKENYVSEDFREGVFQREDLVSTDLEAGIAFPHSLKNIAYKTSMVIAILTEPIIWNTKKVKVVCMYANSCNDIEQSNLFIKLFMSNIDNYTFVESLKKCKTYKQCQQTLLKFFVQNLIST